VTRVGGTVTAVGNPIETDGRDDGHARWEAESLAQKAIMAGLVGPFGTSPDRRLSLTISVSAADGGR
jgi:hypothetical protein